MDQHDDDQTLPPAWGVAKLLLISTTMLAATDWLLSGSPVCLAIVLLNIGTGAALRRVKPENYDPLWIRKIRNDL